MGPALWDPQRRPNPRRGQGGGGGQRPKTSFVSVASASSVRPLVQIEAVLLIGCLVHQGAPCAPRISNNCVLQQYLSGL